MQSHILLPELYLLRKHACRRTIRHTRCMCHTCSRITCCASWICPTGRYAGMQRHNAPHRHRIVCHAHMHVVTYPPKQASTRWDAITYAVTHVASATQACMQLQNPPHRHACTSLCAIQASIQHNVIAHSTTHAIQASIHFRNLAHTYACDRKFCTQVVFATKA